MRLPRRRAAVRHRQLRELLPRLRRVRAGRPRSTAPRCARSVERRRLRTRCTSSASARSRAPALVGNPSDGYHGKTISLIVRNFWAEVVLYEWDTWTSCSTEDDRARFRSVHDLARDVRAARLLRRHPARQGHHQAVRRVLPAAPASTLHDRNFSIRYETTIPRQVGLAGSSAIIVATLRCLMDVLRRRDPARRRSRRFVLSVEKRGARHRRRLAGPRDPGLRRARLHGLRHASASAIVDGLPCYAYEPLDPGAAAAALPRLQHATLSEPTEVFHNDIRGRFRRGEEQVVGGMRRVAGLAAQAREALSGRDAPRLGGPDGRELRPRDAASINLPAWQIEMVEVARACGASAKFAGSGGAIIGIYDGDAMFDTLRDGPRRDRLPRRHAGGDLNRRSGDQEILS